jgi:heme exporter protein B
LGKFLSNWIFTLIVALVLVPLAGFFYGVNPIHWQLLWIVLLGTLGYSLAGVLIAALSQKLRNRELSLPILLFPVLIPLLMSAIRATQIVISANLAAELLTWVGMLAGFDVLMLAVGILLFEPLLND